MGLNFNFFALQAAYNRFLSAFSRFWTQNREEDDLEDSTEDTIREIPKITVDEVKKFKHNYKPIVALC